MLYASCFLAALSSLPAIIPFWSVWKIAACLILNTHTENITHYATLAALSMIIAVICRLLSGLSKSSLPERYSASCYVLALTALLFYADWRLALVSLLPLILGFIAMSMTSRDSLRSTLAEFQKAVQIMSREFMSFNSFKKFADSVNNYEKSSTAYTHELRLPMIAFNLSLNGSFIFLVIAGIFAGLKFGITSEFVINFLLASITAPSIYINIMRIVRRVQ